MFFFALSKSSLIGHPFSAITDSVDDDIEAYKGIFRGKILTKKLIPEHFYSAPSSLSTSFGRCEQRLSAGTFLAAVGVSHITFATESRSGEDSGCGW